MSSTLDWVEAGPYRGEQLYRYSVRCDRAQMRAIERAAKKAGKSATAFVQEHFDRILEVPSLPAAPSDNATPGNAMPASARAIDDAAASRAAAMRPEDLERAREFDIPVPALQLWRVVSTIADARGLFRADTLALSGLLEMERGLITRGLNLLSSRKLIKRVREASGTRLPEWQVLRREM